MDTAFKKQKKPHTSREGLELLQKNNEGLVMLRPILRFVFLAPAPDRDSTGRLHGSRRGGGGVAHRSFCR